jgi:hypothetical protein
MKRFSLLFFLVISLFQYSFSQGEFLQRGGNGFGVGMGFSTNNETNALSYYAGFSYQGILDANLTYSKANGGKVRDGVVLPSITYYPVKQEDAKVAPTLGISLGFSRYVSKKTSTMEEPDLVGIGWHWYEQTTEATVNAVKLGVITHHRMGYWKVFFFQPMLGADLSIISSGWEFKLRGGVAIGTRMKRGPLFILTPCIERQSGLTTFVLTLSAIF